MRNQTRALAHIKPARTAVPHAAQLLSSTQGCEIVEFRGRIQSKRYKDRLGGVPPPVWRSTLSMLSLYHNAPADGRSTTGYLQMCSLSIS